VIVAAMSGRHCEIMIGELMRDASAKVMSIDLNPGMLDSEGKGCVVVDAAVFQGE
jgi:hypothetical protein